MAAGDSIWKYTAAGLAWAVVTGALNLLFRPNAASAGLSSEEFRVQLLRRVLGCFAPALLFLVLLGVGGFVSAVLAPDLSQYQESAIPRFGRIFLEYVIPYAVANFFCVPAVVSITTEIASMRLSRELDVLEVLGLDPPEVAQSGGADHCGSLLLLLGILGRPHRGLVGEQLPPGPIIARLCGDLYF